MAASFKGRVASAIAVGMLFVTALSHGAMAAGRRHAQVTHSKSSQPGPVVHVFATTADLQQALTRLPDIRLRPAAPAIGTQTIRVNDSITYQRITGFGGGLTDSSAWLLYDELPASTRAWILGKLFSRHGINLGFLRVPLGASDFTADGHPYTYDDLPTGQSDPTLSKFSIAHDLSYIIPTLKQALAINPQLELVGSMWSAPPWMKANNAFDNLGNAGGLLPSAYGPLASYFIKFIKAYAAAGVPVSAITPQNEPHAGSPYPGGELPEPNEAQWITDSLDPALVAAGLHPKIYGYDGGATLDYPQALLAGPAAGSLSGIAWHCYGGPHVMSELHALYPSVDQIVSECSPGIVPYPVSEIVISSLRNWASAVALWNLALDPAGGPVEPPNYGCSGCTGIVTADEQTHSIALGLNYYQLGQISKYVEPGAYRIASPRAVHDFRLASGFYSVTQGLDNVAFLNPDGGKVLVAYDNSALPIRFAVRWDGLSFTYTVQPGAMVTFVWS